MCVGLLLFAAHRRGRGDANFRGDRQPYTTTTKDFRSKDWELRMGGFQEGGFQIVERAAFSWEPPDVGLAPTGVWRVPLIPHCNWRTLPSSQTPSLPALSFPLPPTPLGSFARLRERAAQAGGGEGPRAQWGGGGGGLQAALGARPTSGGTRFSLRRNLLLQGNSYQNLTLRLLLRPRV